MFKNLIGLVASMLLIAGCGSTPTRSGGLNASSPACACEGCSCACCASGRCPDTCCADGSCCKGTSCEGCCQGGECAGCLGKQPAAAARAPGVELASYTSDPIDADQAVVFVNGMACPMCATNVDLKLRELPGVADARVNLELGSVVVDLAGPQRPSSAQLAKAVGDAGFTLSKIVVR